MKEVRNVLSSRSSDFRIVRLMLVMLVREEQAIGSAIGGKRKKVRMISVGDTLYESEG